MCLWSDYRIGVLTEWKDRDQFRATEIKWVREESGNKTWGELYRRVNLGLRIKKRSQKAANLALVLKVELGLNKFSTDTSLDIGYVIN